MRVKLLPLFVFVVGASAQPLPPLKDPAPARAAPGWTRQGRSLLLYDGDGLLKSEIPLRAEGNEEKTVEMLGNAGPDGSAAWTLERRLRWDPSRSRVLESQRLFRLLSGSGQELWRDEDVDIPESGEPALISADGKVILIARRGDKGWSAEARNWMGGLLFSVGMFQSLRSIALTPKGRFALARWSETDKSDTHSFLNIAGKERRDVPSDQFPLGVARIDDDGIARSGALVMPIFSSPASPPAVSSSTTADSR